MESRNISPVRQNYHRVSGPVEGFAIQLIEYFERDGLKKILLFFRAPEVTVATVRRIGVSPGDKRLKIGELFSEGVESPAQELGYEFGQLAVKIRAEVVCWRSPGHGVEYNGTPTQQVEATHPSVFEGETC